MNATEAQLPLPFYADQDRIVRVLDRALIYGTIIFIPYDLPLLHQACVPLAAVAAILMVARGDLPAFLVFLRRLPVLSMLAVMLCVIAVASLYGNIDVILDSAFQEEKGWIRGVSQAVLLIVTAAFPFYFAFCLRRHDDWKSLVTLAAWWSLPIPLLVGALQLANFLGVPGLTVFPYVGGAYEGGFWRLTSVARESSWFGSYACVTLPFLALSLRHIHGWRKLAGIGIVFLLLVFVIFGWSKSALAAMAVEFAIGAIGVIVVLRPWRLIGKSVLGVAVVGTALLTTSVASPAVFDKITSPIVDRAERFYQLFEPLLVGNTRFISIGTRFGMSAAGVSMGEAHPAVGVGLGQFGYHAYNYLPIWGINSETLRWLSNDADAWPSTSNLYSRLLAEIGAIGLAIYLSFRLLTLLGVAARLVRMSSPTLWRDLAVFSISAALIAFDFHRDSFINLDMWSALGMALACIHETESAQLEPINPKEFGFPIPIWRFIRSIAAASFLLALGVILLDHKSYQASATLQPESGGVIIAASQQADGGSPVVMPGGNPQDRFTLLRRYWGSRAAAARLLATNPDLVRRALGSDDQVSPSTLSEYLKNRVTVLMADKESTLTLQYRNGDPKFAVQFLTAAIHAADQAVAAALRAKSAQAVHLSQLVLASDTDVVTRQTLLARVAAQELQTGFDVSGKYVSFDYVEHPAIEFLATTPQPGGALPFAFLLAGLTASLAGVVRLLWLRGIFHSMES